MNMDSPIRIDFFDVVAERIKLFEPDSGKSYSRIDPLQIAPATDVFIGQARGEVIGG